MTRDSERSKTYEAEFEVRMMLDDAEPVEMFGTYVAIPDERKFGSVEAVQAYVNAVLKHMDSVDVITVRRRKGVDKAHYSRHGSSEKPWPEIAVPDSTWALREIVILHELAHHFTPDDEPAHGQVFRRTFCDLAEQILAPEARFLLQVSFGKRGLTV